ncbi:MAG: type IV toxin-antitoxin system AbiEi family antitoxin domain-containing protein [Syntrophaceae bacterium]|nr:type IV toxin-antitoxin system AbiEi family antitoxin domain-containing protein [Syntrophaceae bacterium]
MDRKKKIFELAKQMGIIRPRDVEEAGIPREYLLRLYRKGDLTRVGRGLYALSDSLTSESVTLAEVAKRVPNAVVCLLSALQFHNLTTQISPRVWIAIENGKWKPTFDYPPIEVVRFSDRAFNFGVEEHKVDRVPVKVYSPAKTVADCFKFRSKIGLDVALESLRETWRSRKATMDQLWEAAKVSRVANVMRPYLEALT